MKKQNFFTLVMVPYLVNMGFFLGLGLIAGSIVHMPLNYIRYGIILLVGLAFFFTSILVRDIVMLKKTYTLIHALKTIVISMLMSLGIGMVTGGIQHFDDIAQYASVIIPLGIILSFVGYVFLENIKITKTLLLTLVGIISLISLPLYFTLHFVATHMSSNSDHGHVSGDEHAE